MYGLVHDAIEKLVISQFGLETWEEIKRKAACPVDEQTQSWNVTQLYADSVTLDIVGAAVAVLGLSVEQIVETLGQYFISYARVRGFDNMLRSMGADLFSWLQSVNDLHVHLRSALNKDLLFPEIYCREDGTQPTSKSFLLYYRSARGALLAPLVVGIVKKAANVYFLSTVSLERLATQGEADSDYTSWRVELTGSVPYGRDHWRYDDAGTLMEEDEESAAPAGAAKGDVELQVRPLSPHTHPHPRPSPRPRTITHVPLPVPSLTPTPLSPRPVEPQVDEMQKLALLAATNAGGGCPFSGGGSGGALAKRMEVDEVSSAFGLGGGGGGVSAKVRPTAAAGEGPAPLLGRQDRCEKRRKKGRKLAGSRRKKTEKRHCRSDWSENSAFSPAPQFQSLFAAHPDNTLLVKLSYWFTL